MVSRSIAAALTLATVASGAFAADLPSRVVPVVAPLPVLTWSGPYLGLVGGYGESGRTDVVGVPLFGNTALAGGAPQNTAAATGVTTTFDRPRGGFGGYESGYNWQFGSAVVGYESDTVFTDIRRNDVFSSTTTVPGFAGNPVSSTVTANQRLDYLGTARIRVGFLPTSNLLLFGTAGLAYGRVKTDVTTNELVNGAVALPNAFGGLVESKVSRAGYTVGGGAEYMFAPKWSFKVEGLYYDLGRVRSSGAFSNVNTAGTLFTVTGVNVTTRERGFLVRGGLNYQFDFLGYAAGLFGLHAS